MVALATVIASAAALATSCAPAPAPPANAGAGVRIDLNTPQGVRAKQVMDMLNSDWPIGPDSVKTLARPEMVNAVATTMDGLWWDRPYTLAGVDIGANIATLHLLTSYGARQDIDLRTGDDTFVSRFVVTTAKPKIESWQDVDTALSRTGARYSWQVSKVDDGRCTKVAGTNTAESLPLASIFKTYVLFAVESAVTAGTLNWDDKLTITAETKKLGSSGFDKLPPGSQITVRQAAGKMIATSDNMATDLLIGRLGTHAIEQALVAAGHHDPASMTPFPTMREIFSIGWGNPDVREQWKMATPQDRAVLLRQTDSHPYDPDPQRTHAPGSAYGAEWYGSADDICRVHAALQHNAVGRAAPVKDIMSEISGIDLDRTEWPYIGAKAGNLPGDFTFSWYAVDRTGQAWVVSFQFNWPRYHSPNAGGWLMTIIKQVFGLLPRYR
ncbi:serine hydrolase [Mycobacterium sp. CVI_P3]|uniref:Serine hydrolase n=1 Tax=Mycobacterium pinniadriaticum TaxID=2994102 RepID=A0ABT3S6J8_9MYCO|nr:serine hydrolase [Mycobacterium pinniadriaticum]MCX2929004.1 serine hydrolase [Mycobacterium pinniadriaticum]MCX2935129.1 serine hydrolase [Mycobacterium pinniadriaticum]